jgi:hypothetical protein
MRFLKWMAAMSLAFGASASWAQGWFEYTNQEEFFLVAMPAQPQILATTYRAPSGAVLPAKMFISTEGQRRYIATVVHFMNASPADQEAALRHAVQAFRDRGAEITYDMGLQVEGLPAWQIYLRYPDGSRAAASVMWHPADTGFGAAGRLYIMEGRVPPGQAPPIQFPQSFFYLDEAGVRLDFVNQNGRRVRNPRLTQANVAGPYGSREPVKCESTAEPAQGKPSLAQAAQYVKCTMEGLGDGHLFLLEEVAVREVGDAVRVDPSYHPGIDATQMAFPIRGTLKRYACEREGRNMAWGRADPGANCALSVEANASGHCYRLATAGWTCSMSDLHPQRSVKIAPPK